jgi:hypothetical protein
MAIKEFPDIQVELKQMGSKNPFYVGALGVPVAGPSVPLAYALAAGIENTQKFLGATIDVYADGARQASQEGRQVSDDEFLRTLVGEFAEDGWVYGIVLDGNQPNKTERILKTREEMQDFLQGDGFGYDPQKVARTVFVPTERYTSHTWGFDYKPEGLEKMIDLQ